MPTFRETLHRLSQIASTWKEQGVIDGSPKYALTLPLIEALTRKWEEAHSGEASVSTAEDVPADFAIRRSGTPVGFVEQVTSGEAAEGLRFEDENLASKGGQILSEAESRDDRFVILTDGAVYQFFSTGEEEGPFYEFDLGDRRLPAESTVGDEKVLQSVFAALLSPEETDAEEQSVPLTGEGTEALFYIYAFENGSPFGKKKTMCKFGITGGNLKERREAHRRRMGIGDSSALKLCFLAAGPIVLAERLVARRTASASPPGLGPRSEWRWCRPELLVDVAKDLAETRVSPVGKQLGFSLGHEVVWDPFSSADEGAVPSCDLEGEESEIHSEAIGSSPEVSSGVGDNEVGDTKVGSAGPESAKIERAAEIKQAALRGDLGLKSEGQSVSVRLSEKEKALIEESLLHSRYRDWSAFVRDAALGWSRPAPITAKSGLVVHWICAAWRREVGPEEWSALLDLTTKAFSVGDLSESEVSATEVAFGGEGPEGGGPEGNGPEENGHKKLSHILSLIERHLLAFEPRPLQLLKEQLALMNSWDKINEIGLEESGLTRAGILPDTTPPSRARSNGRSRKALRHRAREIRRRVSGAPAWTKGSRSVESLRFSDAERHVLTENVKDSICASTSSYVRTAALGWDRSATVISWSAVLIDWLRGRLGERIGEEQWIKLKKALLEEFGAERPEDAADVPLDDTFCRLLRSVEKRLLGTSLEHVAETIGMAAQVDLPEGESAPQEENLE